MTYVEALNKVAPALVQAFRDYNWSALGKFDEDHLNPKKTEQTNWVEFRFNGPDVQSLTAKTDKWFVELNILVNVNADNKKDPYKARQLLNEAIDFLMHTKFIVPDVGCFQRLDDVIKPGYFGLIATDFQTYQGTVGCRYHLERKNS